MEYFKLDTTGLTFGGTALDDTLFTLIDVGNGDGSGVLRLQYAAPIPEPSTYGLILGGLALAGAAIRRRRKKKD
jgi:hypothetical protein